jgi:transcriptional regulator of arginine metabolism
LCGFVTKNNILFKGTCTFADNIVSLYKYLAYLFGNEAEKSVKERLARLKAIRKLIKTYRIESQEILLGHLQKEGFMVTQATLSRDLKLLKVGKISDGHKGYVYTLPGEDDRQENERTYVHDFLRGYVSIDWSGNMVVIRTYSGHSDSVALAVDNLALDDVLGTIAGRDNTVFVCLREGVTGEDFMAQMREKIPELED